MLGRMSLAVTGTIGIDTVYTPRERREGVLGGSAAYFAAGASFLSPVRLVAELKAVSESISASRRSECRFFMVSLWIFMLFILPGCALDGYDSQVLV
jgi:hypothetical protein